MGLDAGATDPGPEPTRKPPGRVRITQAVSTWRDRSARRQFAVFRGF